MSNQSYQFSEVAEEMHAFCAEREEEFFGDEREDEDQEFDSHDDDVGAEDQYLDSYWEDQAEIGMEGCCGDF